MTEAVVQTDGLSKDYGEGHGLFDLDLEVRRGAVFGFLGPNGAGTATTMRSIKVTQPAGAPVAAH